MKWGVIGHGEISPVFIESLLFLEEHNLLCIASVSKHSVLINSKKYQKTIIYKNYIDLFKNKDVEVVYIATTNNMHKENVLNALNNGKHVLCEKPIGVCKSDTIELIECARKNNKFLMEGMWTRFLPAYREFLRLISTGIIGKPTLFMIDFGFLSHWGPDRRLLNKGLFGGAVLDNTDYNIFAAIDFFNSLPVSINAVADYAHTGVENKCGILLKFPCGGLAHLFSGFVVETNQDAVVYGEFGSVTLKKFWHCSAIVVKLNGQKPKKYHFPFSSTGFVHEIEEVVKCITEGKIESQTIPHQLSIDVAGIMDEVLCQIRK
jgi:predicted dehydrogenase